MAGSAGRLDRPPGLSADTLVITCGVVAALHVGKLPPALPVLLTALAAAANIIGNVMAGRLLHRGRPPVQLLLIGFTTMGLAAFIAFGVPEALTATGRYAAVLAFSAVGGLIPGTLFALAVRVAPQDQVVPAVVGWTLQCSALGQFIGPPAAAWWTSHHGGWSQTWVTTASAAAVGLLLALALGRVLKR